MTRDRLAPGARQFLLSALLTLVLPGLGHFVLGERRKGAGFFVIVAVAFSIGLSLDGRLSGLSPGHPLAVVTTLTTAATGLLSAAARLLGLGTGDPGSATFEFGNGYLLTAGTMNLLLAVDLLARGARTSR